MCRNEIYKKKKLAKKFYTLKVHKLRLFLLTVKHPKSISISRCLKKLTDGVKLFKKNLHSWHKFYTKAPVAKKLICVHLCIKINKKKHCIDDGICKKR